MAHYHSESCSCSNCRPRGPADRKPSHGVGLVISLIFMAALLVAAMVIASIGGAI